MARPGRFPAEDRAGLLATDSCIPSIWFATRAGSARRCLADLAPIRPNTGNSQRVRSEDESGDPWVPEKVTVDPLGGARLTFRVN